MKLSWRLKTTTEKEADNKEAKDKLSAQEMRQKAMERMSQKKKNNL